MRKSLVTGTKQNINKKRINWSSLKTARLNIMCIACVRLLSVSEHTGEECNLHVNRNMPTYREQIIILQMLVMSVSCSCTIKKSVCSTFATEVDPPSALLQTCKLFPAVLPQKLILLLPRCFCAAVFSFLSIHAYCSRAMLLVLY